MSRQHAIQPGQCQQWANLLRKKVTDFASLAHDQMQTPDARGRRTRLYTKGKLFIKGCVEDFALFIVIGGDMYHIIGKSYLRFRKIIEAAGRAVSGLAERNAHTASI